MLLFADDANDVDAEGIVSVLEPDVMPIDYTEK